MSDAFVDQNDLEMQFSKERVAQVFSVQDSSGNNTGVVDPTTLTYAIQMGSAEAVRILIGAYGDAMPFVAPFPDTLKQLVGPLVMHAGFKRRPEYNGKPEESPYFQDWKQARADLEKLRTSAQRLDTTRPGNVRAVVQTSRPDGFEGGYFAANMQTKRGGFNDGDF